MKTGTKTKTAKTKTKELTRPALRLARVMRAREAKRRVRRGIFVTKREDKLNEIISDPVSGTLFVNVNHHFNERL